MEVITYGGTESTESHVTSIFLLPYFPLLALYIYIGDLTEVQNVRKDMTFRYLVFEFPLLTFYMLRDFPYFLYFCKSRDLPQNMI